MLKFEFAVCSHHWARKNWAACPKKGRITLIFYNPTIRKKIWQTDPSNYRVYCAMGPRCADSSSRGVCPFHGDTKVQEVLTAMYDRHSHIVIILASVSVSTVDDAAENISY
jgi:hypothetical protein